MPRLNLSFKELKLMRKALKNERGRLTNSRRPLTSLQLQTSKDLFGIITEIDKVLIPSRSQSRIAGTESWYSSRG